MHTCNFRCKWTWDELILAAAGHWIPATEVTDYHYKRVCECRRLRSCTRRGLGTDTRDRKIARETHKGMQYCNNFYMRWEMLKPHEVPSWDAWGW